MKNSELGLTLQKVICDTFKLIPCEEATNQFNSAFRIKYVPMIEEVIKVIFAEVGSIPKSCITYRRDITSDSSTSPYNFTLSDGRTLNIKTNLDYSGKVAPVVVGQAGYDVLNKLFGHIVPYEIKDQADIKQLVLENASELLPVMLDYLLVSDILVWVYMKGDKLDYKVIYRSNKPELTFDPQDVSFTRDTALLWNESNTIKYKGVSVGEFQVHQNRNFKFRFIMKNVINLLEEVEVNNESFGMSAEKALCNLYDLDYPKHLDNRALPTMISSIYQFLESNKNSIPKIKEHTGSFKGDRGGASKCSYDFLTVTNETLSLKTNVNRNVKVCPPEVGQPSYDTFARYFGHLYEGEIDSDKFKDLCVRKTAEMMIVYTTYLFDSDYLLWIYHSKSELQLRLLSRPSKFIEWKQDLFTFTRDTKSWKESSTVKYKGLTLGEFQIHSKRNSLKFRFNLLNLISLLEEEKAT